jgi:hypothetical protein
VVIAGAARVDYSWPGLLDPKLCLHHAAAAASQGTIQPPYVFSAPCLLLLQLLLLPLLQLACMLAGCPTSPHLPGVPEPIPLRRYAGGWGRHVPHIQSSAQLASKERA